MSSSRTDWKSPPVEECYSQFVCLCLLQIKSPTQGQLRSDNTFNAVDEYYLKTRMRNKHLPGAYSSTKTISCWFWNTSFRWTILLESEKEIVNLCSFFKVCILWLCQTIWKWCQCFAPPPTQFLCKIVNNSNLRIFVFAFVFLFYCKISSWYLSQPHNRPWGTFFEPMYFLAF